MRTIRFFQSADEVSGESVLGTIAVVADVLRATSTIVTALYNGCREVIPVKEVEEARALAASFAGDNVILGGERNGQKIDGFHFGNSPQDYTRAAIAGKTVITTTTNGTKALVHAAAANETLVLSFLNLSAIADYILRRMGDVSAIAAGIYGDFSIEDSACCGLLIDALMKKAPQEFMPDENAAAILSMSQEYQGDIEFLLRTSPHGDFLRKIGFESDLAVCARRDVCPIVPVYKNKSVRIQ